MADPIKDQPTAEPQQTPEVTPPESPEEIRDPQALINAYRRQQELNRELQEKFKAAEQQRSEYAQVMEALQQQLSADNSPPAPTTTAPEPKPSNSAQELLAQFQLSQRVAALKDQAAREAREAANREFQAEIAAAKAAASEARQELVTTHKRSALQDLFLNNGGIAQEFDSFYQLMGNQFIVENGKVTGVTNGLGGSVFIDNKVVENPDDYMIAIRQGVVGGRAAKAAFEEWNRAKGAGTAPKGVSSQGQQVYRRSDMAEIIANDPLNAATILRTAKFVD